MGKTYCGFIAIVGRPNVGKSTLINALVGEKVAIVSEKPQTTRTKITGVLTDGDTQIIFIDTPGMHRPRTKLGQYMVKQASQSIGDVDAAILVTEPNAMVSDIERNIISCIKSLKIPAALAINKIDTLIDKSRILERIAAFSGMHEFQAVVPISAATGDGVGLLLNEVKKLCREGAHMFGGDEFTDQPERVIAGEIIREKILHCMSEEIPHGVAVSIESMKERSDKKIVDINALVYCEKNSHKSMLIGKNGTMLKKIATMAREELELFFQIKINLQVWIKVKEGWRDSDAVIRALGFK